MLCTQEIGKISYTAQMILLHHWPSWQPLTPEIHWHLCSYVWGAWFCCKSQESYCFLCIANFLSINIDSLYQVSCIYLTILRPHIVTAKPLRIIPSSNMLYYLSLASFTLSVKSVKILQHFFVTWLRCSRGSSISTTQCQWLVLLCCGLVTAVHV